MTSLPAGGRSRQGVPEGHDNGLPSIEGSPRIKKARKRGKRNMTVPVKALERKVRRRLARNAEWDSPMFRLAQEQFLKAAEIMNLDENVRERLLFPQRTLIVSFPFRRDEYSQVETAFGYRVQHVLTMGPTKGGIRYHEDVNLGEVSALHVDVVEVCPDGTAVRRVERRCCDRSDDVFAHRTPAAHAAIHDGNHQHDWPRP